MSSKRDGVHPGLLARIDKVLDTMQRLGHPMKIVQGVRTAAQQHELWRQGRELPGKKVTNCDGYITKSNHQPHEDGLGHAVDCAFDHPEPFAEKHPWTLYGAACEAEGLVWGGSWKRFKDRPHAELPAKLTE